MTMPAAASCQIIIAGGRLAAAAEWLADLAGGTVGKAAKYLAAIVRADSAAVLHAIAAGSIKGSDLDQAHAWAELQANRAQMILDRMALGRGAMVEFTPKSILQWAIEDREHAKALTGGEYSGKWTVNGAEGIAPPKAK